MLYRPILTFKFLLLMNFLLFRIQFTLLSFRCMSPIKPLGITLGCPGVRVSFPITENPSNPQPPLPLTMTSEIAAIAKELKSSLKQFPNFPQEGILFEDFLPIFAKPDLFQKLVDAFKLHLQGTKVDYIVGLESRGFLFGPTLALALGAGFIPVRKPGKLPGPTLSAEFKKEYGSDVFEIQEGVIPKDANVVIVDDILATGGSASAAGELVTKAGAKVVEYLFVMELTFLNGKDKLGAPRFTLLSGQDEAL